MENVNGDAGGAISNVVVVPVIQLMKHVLDEEENHEILQTDLRPMENLVLDMDIILQDQPEAAQKILKIWLQLLLNSLTKANSILHRYNPPRRQRCLDYLMCKPGRLSKQVNEWKVHFNYLFQGLQKDFSIFVTAPHSIHKNPMQLKSAQESIVGQDEAWMLFRRIAFKDSPVSLDIEEYARNIADECKGLPLAITLVAAAMMGKTTVDEWRTSLSSIKNADPSSPDTELHSCFDPKPLYQRLIRWSYDALPNSNVKNCFLYCAMYREKELIYVEDLVQKWVAEGLVRSRQGSHLMDMAIGFSYVNLLVDRCFFQNASFEPLGPCYLLLHPLQLRRRYLVPHPLQLVKVHDVIRSMAIYIGEEKENCVLKEGQELKEFPEIHNENCKRISVQRNYIENLPTEFTCPKLVSLFLTTTHISEVPSEFLVSLTSLKVLVLVGSIVGFRTESALSSIPSSVGQLKQLEFLDLRGLDIKDLPEDICHLSALQFLDLSYCQQLHSLPSKIGELKNLKYLNLEGCIYLKVIPHEISQLTSLNTLSTTYTTLTLEAESEASIWSLKGLGNLTTLSTGLREGTTSSAIREGIMGTWLEMRHFCFGFSGHILPRDMQNMRKLQSFIMYRYHGLSLPDYTYKFHHLEYLQLWVCPHLRELSPLERLPNLKYFKLGDCSNLKELGIGNSGRASGFFMLKQLVIENLPKLESIAGPSNHGVWNETILPNLCVLAIRECPRLKRLPKGMEKLVSLSSLVGKEDWWQRIIWEDDNMKSSLQKLFKKWTMDWHTDRFQWKWDMFEYN